ncbi:MAG: AAA family ATPase [Bacteroidetes bacterium]|nr:AAA family ATPase [Bacteroidota bacterium]
MKRELDELFSWFEGRQAWVRDAARRLIAQTDLSDEEITELRDLCAIENDIPVKGRDELKAQPLKREDLELADTRNSLHLDSIANVNGIDALAPRKPLAFGDGQLSIVYGQNGTGKSGYIRILKQACGVRDARPLLGNVFKAPPDTQSCDITYTLDGHTKTITWSPAHGANADLRTCALYDSQRADLYVNEDNEVTFEPPLISLLRRLAKVCDQVKAAINAAMDRKVSKKPELPAEYSHTVVGRWYNTLTHKTTKEEVDKHCAWSKEDEESLENLKKRLLTPDPAEAAKKLRKTLVHLRQLIKSLTDVAAGLSEKIVAEILAAREDAKRKRKAATEAAKLVFKNAPLNGVGSETWMLLWEQARAYSEAEAYQDVTFPNTEADAACVLCQQPLTEDAKARYQSFEAFVTGNLEAAAKAAEARVAQLIKDLVAVPDKKAFEQLAELAGITEVEDVSAVVKQFSDLARRRQALVDDAQRELIPALPDDTLLNSLFERAKKIEAQAIQYEEDAAKDNRAAIQKEVLELSVRKWCNQKRTQIEDEIKRLKLIEKLKLAAKSADTAGITSQSTKLSVVLITDAFATRFQDELKNLGAARLRVQIEKSRSTKGAIKHRISLKGTSSDVESASILSEGEFRIVAIAAFIADVESRSGSTPFLFDDPISSMDENYEMRVANRLIALASNRQVVVFTHRLSLMHNLSALAEKQGVRHELVGIRRLNDDNTGDVDGVPVWAKRPDRILTEMKSARIPQMKKLLDQSETDAYYEGAKALCSDFRSVVERIYETDLLSDVVQRFRREVRTKDKHKHLPLILESDCTTLDEMMTKYSHFLHSQSDETPTPLPDFEEIKADVESLHQWLQDWNARKAAA